MKVFSVAFNRSNSANKKRDDRPFPPMTGENYGTYIISSPPRFDKVCGTLPRSHNRSSVPDLCYQNGFTIYDDDDRRVIHANQKRSGSLSNPESPKMSLKNPFQRSRSSSGRQHQKQNGFVRNENGYGNNGFAREENGFVWPTRIDPIANHRDEPIYSEPIHPMTTQIREAERRTMLKYYPDPNDPVQISNHIYEYLVSRR